MTGRDRLMVIVESVLGLFYLNLQSVLRQMSRGNYQAREADISGTIPPN